MKVSGTEKKAAKIEESEVWCDLEAVSGAKHRLAEVRLDPD